MAEVEVEGPRPGIPARRQRAAMKELRRLVGRNAYARRPDLALREEVGSDLYKKGWELRIVLSTPDECGRVAILAAEAGLMTGRPFQKGLQWIVPMYGRAMVELFAQELAERTGARQAQGES